MKYHPKRTHNMAKTRKWAKRTTVREERRWIKNRKNFDSNPKRFTNLDWELW